MIFYGTNKNKLFFLSFFVIISTVFIALVWLKFSPNRQDLKIKAVTLISDEDKSKVEDNLQSVKNSFALGGDQLKTLQTDLAKTQKQEELLDVTKKYLEEKQATSTEESIK